MAKVNSYLASEIKGLVNPIDFAGAATNKAAIALLRAALSNEETNPGAADARMYLDEMSVMCRNSLVVMLTALEAAVENV